MFIAVINHDSFARKYKGGHDVRLGVRFVMPSYFRKDGLKSMSPIKSLSLRVGVAFAAIVLLWVTGVIPALLGLLVTLAQVWLFLLLAPTAISIFLFILRISMPR